MTPFWTTNHPKYGPCLSIQSSLRRLSVERERECERRVLGHGTGEPWLTLRGGPPTRVLIHGHVAGRWSRGLEATVTPDYNASGAQSN